MLYPSLSSTFMHRALWGAVALCCVSAAQAQTISTRYTDLRRDLFAPASTDVISEGISPTGEAVGHFIEPKQRYDSGTKSYQTVYRRQAVRWSTTGQPTRLAMPADTAARLSNGFALAANASRVTVGYVNDLPAQWSASGQLTTLDARTGRAKAINASGLVGGFVNQSETVNGVTNPNTQRATLWTGGKSQDLHALLGRTVQQGRGSMVVAMTDQGTVAVQEYLYMRPQPVACHLVQGNQVTTLPINEGSACEVLGVSSDNSVLLKWSNGQECTMNPVPACAPVTQPLAVWRQGSVTNVPVGSLKVYSAWMTSDSTVWLQTADIQGLYAWRVGGTLTPVNVTVPGIPAGDVPLSASIRFGNAARQFVMVGNLAPSTGGIPSRQSAGLLVPR